MRAGWNDGDRNAPLLAQMVQDAGAAAVTIHGRTAEQSYKGLADWELVARVASTLDIPVLGSGDCVEPEQIIERLGTGVSGVLVGRGVLRNPWILAQAADVASGRPPRAVSLHERGQFLLDYIQMLLDERVNEADGFRHVAPGALSEQADEGRPGPRPRAVGHQQASGALFVVLEGARRWLAAARPRQQRGARVSAATDCRRVFSWPKRRRSRRVV